MQQSASTAQDTLSDRLGEASYQAGLPTDVAGRRLQHTLSDRPGAEWKAQYSVTMSQAVGLTCRWFKNV